MGRGGPALGASLAMDGDAADDEAHARELLRVGTCPSTTSPITVAVAGRSETRSAYVSRRMRAMASWSQTYGITDDVMPTPIPARSAAGARKAGAAAQPPIGVATRSATSIAAASPSIPPSDGSRETRWPSTM